MQNTKTENIFFFTFNIKQVPNVHSFAQHQK